MNRIIGKKKYSAQNNRNRRHDNGSMRYLWICVWLIVIGWLLFNVSAITNYIHNINLSKNINHPQIVSFRKTNIISNASIDYKTHLRGTSSTIKSIENYNNKKKVAYAVTVTKDSSFVDGALVLGYAAHKVHGLTKSIYKDINNENYNSIYDIDLIAFVAPSVNSSRNLLQKYGWKILERPLPVELYEIENKDYAEKMKNSGCCGASEFLKLWAYTLTEYDRVIHLDMDSIIYQNMDELYNTTYELQHTGDYNMAVRPVPPVQGGFLVIKPSKSRFEEFRDIIRKGDYHPGSGWAQSHIGKFWGGSTIQGIMPYFYHKIHSGDALELNRCIYNVMVDNPYRPYKDEDSPKKCLNGQPTCEDCRKQKFHNVKSAHFTICQKPWTCTKHDNPRNKVLCEQLHQEWFILRHEFEIENNINTGYRYTQTKYKESLGICRGYGDKKYIPIPIK